MELKRFRVRPGAVLAHHGQDLTEGTAVELAPHIGYEVRHLVEPVNEHGDVLPHSISAGVAALESELASAKPHEHVSLIEMALTRKQVKPDDVKELLEAAKKAEAKVEKKAAPAAEAKVEKK